MKLSLLLVSVFLLQTTPFLPAQTQPEVFDVSVYESIYPDIFNAYGTGNTAGATNHWINLGLPAGRRASIIFDPVYFINNNPSVGQIAYPAACSIFCRQACLRG